MNTEDVEKNIKAKIAKIDKDIIGIDIKHDNHCVECHNILQEKHKLITDKQKFKQMLRELKGGE